MVFGVAATREDENGHGITIISVNFLQGAISEMSQNTVLYSHFREWDIFQSLSIGNIIKRRQVLFSEM